MENEDFLIILSLDSNYWLDEKKKDSSNCLLICFHAKALKKVSNESYVFTGLKNTGPESKPVFNIA